MLPVDCFFIMFWNYDIFDNLAISYYFRVEWSEFIHAYRRYNNKCISNTCYFIFMEENYLVFTSVLVCMFGNVGFVHFGSYCGYYDGFK
jgi:hypothetical protein